MFLHVCFLIAVFSLDSVIIKCGYNDESTDTYFKMELFVWVEISIIIITRIVTYKTIYYKYLRKPKKTRSSSIPSSDGL